MKLETDVGSFAVRLHGNVGARHHHRSGRRYDCLFVPKKPRAFRDKGWIIGPDAQPADLGLWGRDNSTTESLGQELPSEADTEDRDIAIDRLGDQDPLASNPSQLGVVHRFD